MKKNLIFLTLLISVLMISVVSAGITGYVLELRRGVAVSDDNLGRTSVQSVSEGTATFAFTDPNTGRTETLSGTEGQILTTSSGTQVEVGEVTTGTLFRRANVEINVVPASGEGVGKSGSNPSCNGVYDDTLNTNTFRYWAKKNNLDYHEYISVTSNSGQHYFLDFRPREDLADNRNETDVYNVVTGLNEATDKIAGDVVTIGNIQITIVEVYVNATDKYVDLEISGGYFSDSCTEGTGNTCLLNNLCGGTFIDLNSCSFEYGVQTTSNPTKSLDCGSGKVVLNHDATCNNLKERPSLSGYGYISPPTFPSAVSYTCVNATGTEILPDSVQGFCCGIKNL